MPLVSKLFSKIVSIAKWYMRRRLITRLLIFFAIFILPILVYSYWQASIYTTKYTAHVLVEGSGGEGSIRLPTVPCTRVFRGKTLYIFGALSVPNTCYSLNESVILYEDEGRVNEIILSGNRSEEEAIVLVIPAGNRTLTVNNASIPISTIILVVFGDSYSYVKTILEEYSLLDTFCRVAIPSTGWSQTTVPEKAYDYICLSKTG